MLARMARSVDLPPPPRDRIWLLRSPWASLRLSSLLLVIGQHRDRNGFGWDAVANMRAAQDLLSRTEEEVWASWTGRQADAARGWHRMRRGTTARRGVDPARAGPGHVDTLLAPLDEGGARAHDLSRPASGARSWRCVRSRATTWCDSPSRGDGLVCRRCAGRAARDRSCSSGPADEVAAWLDGRSQRDDVAVWQGRTWRGPLRWREAASARVRRGSSYSPTRRLTPEAGPRVRRRRHRPAASGTAGSLLDSPGAGSSMDLPRHRGGGGPRLAVARPGARRGREQGRRGGAPCRPDVEVGWAGFGSDRDDVSYGVTDPPGTRGIAAHAGPDGIPLPERTWSQDPGSGPEGWTRTRATGIR